MIICDTREKKNQHIIRYFERNSIPFEVQKLETGDYMDTDNPTITIDRKQNLDELRGNLFSSDKGRFWREVRRSKAERIKMIVLVEHGNNIKTLKDIISWRSRYSKITGAQLYSEACRCHIAYGVEFLFCNKGQTGRLITELLCGDLEEKNEKR